MTDSAFMAFAFDPRTWLFGGLVLFGGIVGFAEFSQWTAARRARRAERDGDDQQGD
ncbi:MAG: hypothetical protein IT547_17525 [Hyphomonadaceae bacterium]|nr:hypothetical protein [Hyphomonadaceae bacterium]